MQIRGKGLVCNIDDRKITDCVESGIADKRIAIKKFTSAAMGLAQIGFLRVDNALLRRSFSFDKFSLLQLDALKLSNSRESIQIQSCKDIKIRRYLLGPLVLSTKNSFGTPLFRPSTTDRTTPECIESLANESVDVRPMHNIILADCGIFGQLHSQQDVFTERSPSSNCIESYDCPSFIGSTADLTGETLVIITSEKLSISEMLLLNDDTSIISLRHFKSLWSGLSSNDELLFHKSMRNSEINVPHPADDTMIASQFEHLSLRCSNLDGVRRDTSHSDTTVVPMTAITTQSQSLTSCTFIPHCKPQLTSSLQKDLTMEVVEPQRFPSSESHGKNFQDYEIKLDATLLNDVFNLLCRASKRTFPKKISEIMSHLKPDYMHRESSVKICVSDNTAQILAKNIFNQSHCNEQPTASAITTALVPFEGAPLCETSAADSVEAGVSDPTISSTESGDQPHCNEQPTASAITTALVPFEGAPLCETSAAVVEYWQPSVGTLPFPDKNVVPSSFNHSWAPFLLESTINVDEIPAMSARRLRKRRFVSKDSKNTESSMQSDGQSTIKADTESVEELAVVVKSEIMTSLEEKTSPISWFLDFTPPKSKNTMSPQGRGRNLTEIKKQASWFDDDLTSIASTNAESESVYLDGDDTFDVENPQDTSTSYINSATNHAHYFNDLTEIDRSPNRQKNHIRSILKKTQTLEEVVKNQTVYAEGTNSPRLDEDECNGLQVPYLKRVKFAEGTKVDKSNVNNSSVVDVKLIGTTISTSTQISTIERPQLDNLTIKNKTSAEICTQVLKKMCISVDELQAKNHGIRAQSDADLLSKSINLSESVLICDLPDAETISNESADVPSHSDMKNVQSVMENRGTEHGVGSMLNGIVSCTTKINIGKDSIDEVREDVDYSTSEDDDDIFHDEELLCLSTEGMFIRPQYSFQSGKLVSKKKGTDHSAHIKLKSSTTKAAVLAATNQGLFESETNTRQVNVLHDVVIVDGLEPSEAALLDHRILLTSIRNFVKPSPVAGCNDDGEPVKVRTSSHNQLHDGDAGQSNRKTESSSSQRRRKKYDGIIKMESNLMHSSEKDVNKLDVVMHRKGKPKDKSNRNQHDEYEDSLVMERARREEKVTRQSDHNEQMSSLSIQTFRGSKVAQSLMKNATTEEHDGHHVDVDEEDVKDGVEKRGVIGCSDLTWDLLNEEDEDEDDSLFEDSPTDFSYHRAMHITSMLRLDDTTAHENSAQSSQPQAER